MDLFRKKRIEHLEGRVLELEAQIREMKNREASLETWHERRKNALDERERVLLDRSLAQVGQLDRLQKKFRRIRTIAMNVRAGNAPMKKLFKEILNGKVR